MQSTSPIEIHFAPMQGYVDHVYRPLHAKIYGGIDAYYTPFIGVESGEPRHQDVNRLKVSKGDGTVTVPQIIFGSADEFRMLVGAVKSLGFQRIDLNLGCPYPMQTNRGRGAAMITNLDVMRQVADLINADNDVSYSVKMRIGDKHPADWRQLMPILNNARLCHIALHPRISSQKYDGDMYMEEAQEFIEQSMVPVIFNGDVASMGDIDRIARMHDNVAGVMIGRGLLARPSLAAEWRDGAEWPAEKRLDALKTFHDQIFEAYSAELCGAAQILQKIKTFWEYQQSAFDRKSLKLIRKANTLSKYADAASRAFAAAIPSTVTSGTGSPEPLSL